MKKEIFFIKEERIKQQVDVWFKQSKVLTERIPYLCKALNKVGNFGDQIEVVTTSLDEQGFLDYLKVIDKNGICFEFPLITWYTKDSNIFKEYLNDHVNTYKYYPIKKGLKKEVEVKLIKKEFNFINGTTLIIISNYGKKHPKNYILKNNNYECKITFVNETIDDNTIAKICAEELPCTLNDFFNILNKLFDFTKVSNMSIKEKIDNVDISNYEIDHGNVLKASYKETREDFEAELEYEKGQLKEEYKLIRRIPFDDLDNDFKEKVEETKKLMLNFKN